MKYLKLFEAEKKKNHINWEMIEDIKDMSLEYLDEGMVLDILIIERAFPIAVSNFYMRIQYSHRGEILDGDIDHDYTSEYEFGYSVSLVNYEKTYINLDETVELMNRIGCAYPNGIFKKWN